MCGIAGEYTFGSEAPFIHALEKVNLKQQSRGPDGGGVYHLNSLALAHTRLKIFDLTDRAAQPMVDHGLGLAMVFNGAIYNFRELRETLESKGYSFVSDSDTEVLLKAYHAWGKDCIEQLHGMFAFAIWERETGILVLARDRVGIKPLYYANCSGGFKFASTLPALLEFDGIDTSIDKAALQYYLTLHAVPEPLTMLSGVRKLSPGTIMTVYPDGRTEQKQYWNLRINEDKADQSSSENEWLEKTQKALELAVSRQFSADVPVGVLLSGGLDSSLLVALAAKTEGKRLETFSIGFESANGEDGDEFIYSDKVAEHFNTAHHKMWISNRQLADSLGECVAAMSEPMTSHDNIGFYLLSREVSRHVKVALSGQGADEIFAGYSWFHTMSQKKATAKQSAKMIMDKVMDRTFDDYTNLVAPEFRSENHSMQFIEKLCAENGSSHPVDNLLAYESTFALTNGPLGRVDNMTMSASLEARVPLLDEAVVELAMTMPLRYKMADGGKYVLKQLGRKMLPREVVDRPKGYFPVPALKYMQGSTLDLMRDVLSPVNVACRGIFNPDQVNAMLENPSKHLTPSGGSKLWQIGLLEYWLQQQGL